jgi:hypothetical protein
VGKILGLTRGEAAADAQVFLVAGMLHMRQPVRSTVAPLSLRNWTISGFASLSTLTIRTG